MGNDDSRKSSIVEKKAHSKTVHCSTKVCFVMLQKGVLDLAGLLHINTIGWLENL